VDCNRFVFALPSPGHKSARFNRALFMSRHVAAKRLWRHKVWDAVMAVGHGRQSGGGLSGDAEKVRGLLRESWAGSIGRIVEKKATG
jgi:hypothetical protein